MPRKTSKLLIILWAVLFLSARLPASTWRVAAGGDDGECLSLVLSALSLIPYSDNPSVMEAIREREEGEEKVKKNRETASYYEKESGVEKKAERTLSSSSRAGIAIIDVDLSPYSSFLSDSDSDAIRYLKIRHSLDGVIWVSTYRDSLLTHYTLYLDGIALREGWYSPSLASYEEEALVDLFLSILTDGTLGVYRFSLSPPDAAVTVDGEALNGDIVVLEKGEHTLSASAEGAEKMNAIWSAGDERDVSISLREIPPHPLYVITYPFEAVVKTDGKDEGKSVRSVSSPYSLSASAPGFAPSSWQSAKDGESVVMTLSPSWVEERDLLKEGKERLYRSLFTTLAVFGLSCGATAVDNINPSNLSSAMRIVLTGGTIVSLIDLLDSAARYYAAADLSI